MRAFAIDIYIWRAELSDWLWVPARGSGVRWPAFPGISQADLLSSTAGITFRVDTVLWLGNERDGLPVEMWAFELSNARSGGKPGELLARLNISEYLSIEIRQGGDEHHLLLSRWSSRDAPGDYLEETARAVGTYYRDFPVELAHWTAAVSAALGGFCDALLASPTPGPRPENEPFANWLISSYGSQCSPS
jgi:hypothetical protein